MKSPFAFLVLCALLVFGCSKAKSPNDAAAPSPVAPDNPKTAAIPAPVSAVPPSTHPLSARELFAEGQELATKKDYGGAIARVKEAARLAPQNAYYWQTLAWLENNAGRHADALEHAQKSIRLNDRNGASYFFAGWAAYRLKDYPQARSYFQKVRDLGPDSCGKENFEQARVMLEDLREDVLNAKQFFEQGEELEKKKDLAGAIAKVKEAARLAPTNAYYWQTLAWLENNAKRHADALEHARKALALDDNNGYALFYGGWAAYELNDYVQARTYFQKVREFGVEKCGRVNYESALWYLDQVSEETLKAKELFAQGQALQEKKDVEGAITRVKEAARLAPKNEYYWQTLAWLENSAKRHADALEHARKALTLNDRNGYAHYFAGQAAYELKDYAQARACFQRVRELGVEKCGEANYESALWYLGQVSEEGLKARELVAQAEAARAKKDYDAAILKLKEAVRLAPKNDFYWQTLASVEISAGQDSAALEHARQALQLDKDSGYSAYFVGLAAYGAQELAEARKFFEVVRRLGPDKCGKENYQSALEKLANLTGRTYSITWTVDPQKGSGDTVRIPLPATGLPYQTSTFKLTGAKRSEVIQEDGERFLLVEPNGKKPFQLHAQVTVKAFSYKKQIAGGGKAAYPKQVALYVGFGHGIDPTHPRIAKLASELKGPTPIATIQNILAWLKKNMQYDKDGIGTTAEEIVEKGKGHCVDYSKVFTALSRAAGIPTRVVRGVQKPTEASAPPGQLSVHAWAEVYLSGAGWVPVEPQAPNSLGFYNATYIRQCHFLHGGKNRSDDNASLSIDQLESLAGTTPRYQEKPVVP